MAAEFGVDPFTGYVLRQCGLGSFYLEKPGMGRMGSVLILFTAEGIVLAGDGAPRRGLISDFRYGCDWFAGALSPDYLCEKFLDKVYVPEEALEIVREWESESDVEDFEIQEHARELLEEVRRCGIEESALGNHADFCRWWVVHVNTCYEGEGMAYPPLVKGRLVLIQRAFARLYREMATSQG